ncbi:MAG: radical SAM protein [Lentisphaerae bacterium]|nr:radical SAM protein [Lentisphaerota bacterium]
MNHAHASYSPCRLCPRQCGTDRQNGTAGVCGETAELRIASHGPHMGEEPCFSGTRGSGAIFFSGCPCHCFFCQNWQISSPHGKGRPVTPDEFHRLALDLIDQGVHNLNFVTPDHFWPHIQTLCARLRDEGMTLPFLFNASGYQLPAMIARYAAFMDIFLPDFKFADPVLARTVLRDERYPEIALEALRLMVAEKGFLDPFDPTGIDLAKRGVLVRHLVLPGHVENSLRALDLLREEFGRWLPLSLMSQYTPVPATRNRPPFDRPLDPAEYQTALDHAIHLGFENLLIQPPGDSGDFLPDFERHRPFRGNP